MNYLHRFVKLSCNHRGADRPYLQLLFKLFVAHAVILDIPITRKVLHTHQIVITDGAGVLLSIVGRVVIFQEYAAAADVHEGLVHPAARASVFPPCVTVDQLLHRVLHDMRIVPINRRHRLDCGSGTEGPAGGASKLVVRCCHESSLIPVQVLRQLSQLPVLARSTHSRLRKFLDQLLSAHVGRPYTTGISGNKFLLSQVCELVDREIKRSQTFLV